eukprot:80199-Ditylum_brightwellii.AAC.1
MGVVGFILEVHTTLTRKEELEMEIRDVLAIVDVKNDKEVEKWKEENNIGDMEEKNVVTKFSLFTGNY